MRLTFDGEIIYWRGPSPFHFISVPDDQCIELRSVAPLVSYGWGVLPVLASVGETEFSTSLFPKSGGYLVPVKDAVRRSENVGVGDRVAVTLTVNLANPLRR